VAPTFVDPGEQVIVVNEQFETQKMAKQLREVTASREGFDMRHLSSHSGIYRKLK
jgi:hypothetical protein